MRAESFGLPPVNGEAIHQLIDRLFGMRVGMGAQVGVFGGAQDGAVAEDFLYLDQFNAGFDYMRGIAVTKAVGGDLFFMPHSAATLRRVLCTPPRSSGVLAR